MTTQTSLNNTITNSDLSVSNSFVASTISTTITNTDNSSTSSRAYAKSLTGGASAGDPKITLDVSGETSYSIGVDNSDSDTFKISAFTALGTTDVARCSAAGEWTYFDRPAFCAISDANPVLNVSGDNTVWGPVRLPTEVFDSGGYYDNGTFTYTFPADGVYIITACGRLDTSTTTDYCSCYIYTSNVDVHTSVNAGVINFKGASHSQVFYNDDGDTCYMKLASGGGLKIDDQINEIYSYHLSAAMVA